MRAREGQADCEEAIAQLLGEAEASSDRAARVDCLQRAADIYESQTGEFDKAATVWQAAFTEDFSNERSGQALERLAERRGTGAALLDEMRALLADITDPRQRAALTAWVGRWTARFGEDRDAGEALLLEALRLDPGSTIAEKTLRVLANEPRPKPRPVPRPAPMTAEPPPVSRPSPVATRPTPSPEPRSSDESWSPRPFAPAVGVQSGVVMPGPRPVTSALPTAAPTAPEAITRTLTGHGLQASDALHRRLDALVDDGRWAEAVDVLKALADGADPVMSAKYFTTAGKIIHHKIGNDVDAVDLFNRALDCHPDDLSVFERLYQILAGRRAWRDIESNLLRMIARIKADDALEKAPTLEALWRRLGDVYRVGLEDPVSAANAYQMCARLAPQDPRYPTMIAQLSERTRG
jgi:tetratricopeptide (TPR) repeat protein